MFFAYDPGDEFETLRSAANRLMDAGFLFGLVVALARRQNGKKVITTPLSIAH
jgi:hypothetical protein